MALGCRREQLGTLLLQANRLEMSPESLGETELRDGFTVRADEHEPAHARVRPEALAIDAQRSNHASVERPRARVIRLVLVEADGNTPQVDAFPSQRPRFVRARATPEGLAEAQQLAVPRR